MFSSVNACQFPTALKFAEICPCKACSLILSYYFGRKQCVKIGETRSEWLTISKGAAQGSHMGPLCYNIFSNDLLYDIDEDVDIYNYADDNSLVCSGYDYETVKSKLMHNVDKITNWFIINHMKVNQDKFQCIVFGKTNDLGTFRVGNNCVAPEENVKILGLHVDAKLNFKTHISHVCCLPEGWQTGSGSCKVT